MKPGRKIFLLLLTTVMVLLLLPQSVVMAEEIQDNGSSGDAGGVITVFATLTDAVRNQTVDIGTRLDELILPDTLSVASQVYGEGDTIEEAQEMELAGFTWQSGPEYDPLAGGEYIFTPVLPEGWVAQDGVAMPKITVIVGEAAMPMGMELLSSVPAEYVFDVSEGNITIDSAGGGQLTVTYGAGQTAILDAEQQITITGSSTPASGSFHTNSVTVSPNLNDFTVYITLDNVSIENSYSPPLSVGAYSTVDLTLLGTNTLDGTSWINAGDGSAGLEVPYNATLVISDDSTGSLTATGGYNGAGIGSSWMHNGMVTINGGTVTANGGYYGAGIGGGANGGGTVTINGGTVTARGMGGGAGIGGGSWGYGTVTINGGTVTATGSHGGAGIGGGESRSGAVTVNGGSVNASPAPSTVTNNGGSSEYLVTISGLPASVDVSYEVNGGIPVSCSTDNNSKLYLWLCETTGSAADTILISSGGSQYAATGAVSTGTNNFTAYFPLNTTPTAAPGTASGTTTVTANPNTDGDVLEYLVSTSFITAPEMNSTSIPAGAVTSGSNLAAAAGDWVGVYELNGSGQVVAFGQIQLIAYQISAVATTITTQPATVDYGGSITLSATLSPGVAGKTIRFTINGEFVGNGTTDGSGVAKLNTTLISIPVGSYPIHADFAGDPDFAASSGSAYLTVNLAPLTITAADKTRAYGSANPAFTVSYSGFVNGDTESALGGALTLTTPATAASGAGTYPITPSGLFGVNYAITFIDGTLTVNPAPLTITADGKSKTYGDPNPAFTTSYSGFVMGQDPSVLGGALTLTTPATAASSAGTYSVTPSGLTSVNYAITFVNGTLTVNPVPLTITANAASKAYGSANPAFTASYSGFVNGDTESVLGGSLSFITQATASSGLGTYSVTPSGLTSVNYAITFVDGTLTVNPAPLTITADDKAKAYGSANPAFTASYSGLVLGQDPSVLGGSLSFITTATASSGAGTYPITPSGLISANYAITFVDGTLTVNPAPLTITADGKSKTYGDPNPAFTASYSGFVLGQDPSDLGGALTLTTPASAASGVGSYAVTPSGLTSVNYAITFVEGNLTVNPAPLTVTADDKAKTYGSANPAFTAVYSGFVNGDTESALGGALSFTTPATAASGVGSYAVTPSGLTSVNYAITFVDGTLIVNPAPLTVTANDASKAYGSANPTFTASYSGFVNGDTESSLTGTLVFTTTATAASGAGSYEVTPSGLTSVNYAITFVDGTLTVTPAPLTITADNKTKTYGEVNPAFTASYSGFVNGDTESSLGTLSFTTPATASSGVGSYEVTPSGLTSVNYAITFVGGNLTVTPAPLTITADNKTKIYGEVNPAFTASYSGFVNGDTGSSLTGTLSFTTPATAASGADIYAVTPSGLTAANYAITFVDGNLTVNPAPLTITANDASKAYGSVNPAFTASYSGFVNGDTVSSLTGTLVFTTTATAASVVGSYPITPSGLTSDNYSISYVDGTLTVTSIPTTGGGGNSSGSKDTSQPVNNTTGSATVTPAAGGAVSIGSDVTLNIPANALQGNNSAQVAVQKVDTPPPAPSGFMFMGTAYQLTVNGQDHYSFNQPVTLTFTFDPSSLASGETPAVHYYDEDKGQWVNIGGTVSGNTITVTVDHFTEFAVMAAEKGEKPQEQEPSAPLTDISGHWAEGNINKLVAMGAISGYPDGTFKPDSTITRAEFATVLVKTFQLAPQEGRVFADTASHWAKNYISTAAACGIVGGYDENTFGPNDPVTREQMAVMAVKAAKLSPANKQLAFKDSVDISTWAREAVATVVQGGIMKGNPDGTFRPGAYATRAEASSVIVNALNK